MMMRSLITLTLCICFLGTLPGMVDLEPQVHQTSSNPAATNTVAYIPDKGI